MVYKFSEAEKQSIRQQVTLALEHGHRVELIPLKDNIRIFVSEKRREIKYKEN